jgi:hypothetical protein
VSDELANRMSLFFAHSSPITRLLIDSLKGKTQTVFLNLIKGSITLTAATDLFSILAGVAYYSIEEDSYH